jgi:hypothetical protein
MNEVKIYRRMVNVVLLSFGYDLSGDIITSQIRRGRHVLTDLVSEFEVEFVTDGTDGDVRLTLDDSGPTSDIPGDLEFAYMDAKRLMGGLGGDPVPMFAGPLVVRFVDVLTE